MNWFLSYESEQLAFILFEFINLNKFYGFQFAVIIITVEC